MVLSVLAGIGAVGHQAQETDAVFWREWREIKTLAADTNQQLNKLVTLLSGDPVFHTTGLVERVEKVERAVTRIMFTVPVSLILGTALGQLVSNWIGV